MAELNTQFIETAVVLLGYVVTHYVTNNVINEKLKQTQLQRGRRKIIVKAVHLFSFITLAVLLSAIWGLEQNEIAVFVGTTLTVFGVGFFAQWSLLSNITSSVLLFFNHPVKIGDTVKVLDKDCPFEGEVSDLTYFFILLKTEKGEIITIPNSLAFQKTIVIIEKAKPQN